MTTRISSWCLFAAGLLGLCWTVLAQQRQLDSNFGQAKANPTENNPAGRQTIPPGPIYSTTNGQQGLKWVTPAYKSSANGQDIPIYPYSFDLKQILSGSGGMGASNIFLARGKDIAAAIRSSRHVFVGGAPADVPPQPDRNTKSDKFWLVAYLGESHSFPPVWLVEPITVNGQGIEFRYKKPKYSGSGLAVATTMDRVQYLYWVRLPQLKAGIYELKLFDVDQGRVTLARWVRIP